MVLERTQMGNPFQGVSVRGSQANPDSKLTALAAMANLGASVSKTIADEQEAQSVIDAQNDLVNSAINPDKAQHQAAYAWTVAEGEALAAYNQMSEGVQQGAFKEVDPTDFQDQLKKGHQEYYKKWEGNPHASGAIGAYNSFMLKNQSRITAAQAGTYRLDQKDKQGAALSVRITEMAKSGINTVDDFKAEIEAPKYSLLDPEDRLSTILTGIGVHAKETGDVTVLEALDKEYGLSANPKFSAKFEGDITAANRKRTAISDTATLKQLMVLDAFVEEGTLTPQMFDPISKMHDAKGSPIMSPESFNALLRKSGLKRAEKQAVAQYDVGFSIGQDLNNVPQKDFNKVAETAFNKVLAATDNKQVAFQKIGELLAQQTNVWTDLQDRVRLFDRSVMMIGNVPNKEAMNRFHELEALHAGMNTYTDGEVLFAKYLGDSYVDYLEIKSALDRTSTTPEAAWTEIATSRTLIGTTAKSNQAVTKLSRSGLEVGRQAAKDKWQASDKWYIPDFLENAGAPDDPMSRVITVGAAAYDQKIAEGRSVEVATRFAKVKTYAQVERWGGELFDTHGIGMKALLGTSDTEGAFQTMLQDPEFGAKINEMFGLSAMELFLGDYTQADRLEREAGWFGDPTDPAVAERLAKKRKGATLHTFSGNIRKTLNIQRGTLDLDSEDGETVFSIPLATIGALHNAKIQGVEEIQSLNRLYSPEFLSTDAGRLWHDQQADANDRFAHEILGTDKVIGRTHITPEEYNAMTQKGKTKIRKQFYKDNYSGAMGTLAKIADYFNLKRTVKEEAAVVSLPMPSDTVMDVQFTKNMIKQHERLSLEPYKDGTGQSVGYGHFILPGEDHSNMTKEKAEALFERDFPKYYKAAQGIPGFARASGVRKAALVDMTYNLGVNWYKNWDETPRALAAGEYGKAADLLEGTLWYEQVGDRGKRIVDMIRNG